MAYFVKIGAIPENKSGVGSRGYHAYRRGKRIIRIWGAVQVMPGRRFYWAHIKQQKKTIPCVSVAAAIQSLADIADDLERKRYSRLPLCVHIQRSAKSSRSVKRR